MSDEIKLNKTLYVTEIEVDNKKRKKNTTFEKT